MGKDRRRHEAMGRLMRAETLLCPANRKGRKVRFSGQDELAGPARCGMNVHACVLNWLHTMRL